MTASGPKPIPSLGFLTVQQTSELGLIGGYLILNSAGRPLEFHCTAPVRPSRAQEILYGPTLAPYLYGEQIGQTLIDKGKSRPLFICTDVEPALAARDFVSVPMVLVDGVRQSKDTVQLRLDSAHETVLQPTKQKSLPFDLADCRVAVTLGREQDRDEVLSHWGSQVTDIDLREPFSRLHEAIEEAQRGAGR